MYSTPPGKAADPDSILVSLGESAQMMHTNYGWRSIAWAKYNASNGYAVAKDMERTFLILIS